MRLIGLFLAILELIKKQSIFAHQDENFGEIHLVWSQSVNVF
jgi:chromatin segregation and condensation protein Rec8/ScpA/Scc1 (kleisin family)